MLASLNVTQMIFRGRSRTIARLTSVGIIRVYSLESAFTHTKVVVVALLVLVINQTRCTMEDFPRFLSPRIVESTMDTSLSARCDALDSSLVGLEGGLNFIMSVKMR